MKYPKIVLALLMVIVMALPMTAVAEEAPFRMSLLAESYLAEYPASDSEVLLMIQDYTNTELDITWMFDSKTEKISATLASGEDMPMVLYVPDAKSYMITSAARAGMFWDLEPYVGQFPNLAEMYAEPVRTANSSVLGHTYGLYRKRPLGQDGIIYRSDWAKNLGIEAPVTIDDFYAMLKAFKENDPDGNGVNDTFGMSLTLTETSEIQGFRVMLGAFGSPNVWKWENDVMVPEFVTEEYKACMDFYKKLYDEGLVNADFVTNKELYIDFNAGRSGSYISFMSNVGNQNNELFALNPDATIDLVGMLEGPKGLRNLAAAGFAGQFMFSKVSIKDEETLLKCLNFFDKLSDEPMQNLLRWGLEDKHYVRNEDGLPVRTGELNTAYTNEVNCFRTLKLHYDEKAMDGVSDYAYQRARELYVINEPYAVINPCMPLTSESDIEYGADLSLMINDATVQYVVGAIDADGFQKVVDQWYAQGGQTIIDEYTAAYLETIR